MPSPRRRITELHAIQLMQRYLLSNWSAFFSPSTSVPKKPALCPQLLETPHPSPRVGLSSEWDGSSQPKKFLDGVMNRSKVNIIRANTYSPAHSRLTHTDSCPFFFLCSLLFHPVINMLSFPSVVTRSHYLLSICSPPPECSSQEFKTR